ncbi:MAG: hypothetical protein ACYC8T_31885 [Myxococcaceae bacterium]
MKDAWLLLVQVHAPFEFRFMVQPLMAILLGLRDAKRDSTAGLPPYALSLLTVRASRKTLLQQGLKTVAAPLGIAIVLDGVVQFLVARHVEVWKAVVVGVLLIGLPYILSRGMGNRLFSRLAHRREEKATR